jgi:hypothetical protein
VAWPAVSSPELCPTPALKPEAGAASRRCAGRCRTNLNSSRRFVVGSVVAALFFAAAWLYALNSPQYRQAKTVVESEQFLIVAGRVKLSILVGFNITSVEGRSSSIALYVFGERASGYLRVNTSNGQRNLALDSVFFRDRPLQSPFVRSESPDLQQVQVGATSLAVPSSPKSPPPAR